MNYNRYTFLRIIGFILLMIAFMCCVSCSPQSRLARLVKKHPELVKTDTVWKKDTVIVFGTKFDTVIKIFQRDTVIIKKDQLTLKYFMRNDSTIYLEGECDTVKIIREIPVQVNSIEVKERTLREKIADFVYNNIIPLLLLMAFVFYLWRNKKTKTT